MADPWRAALLVEYLGANYNGFQLQLNQPTIQGALEEALAWFTEEAIRIRGASRTDSGAHAEGQVVDFLTRTRLPLERFAPALNYYLPDDVAVLKARQVDESFNARRTALSRTYRYRILEREWPSPLRRGTHFWVRGPLDAEAMDRAAQALTGIHDFRPLAAGHPEDRSAVRNAMRWQVSRKDDLVEIECEANGFLKHQIRKANGILVEIGKGKQPESLVKRVLEGGETIAGIPMLSAHGLCLIEVKYPERIFADRTADQTNEEN